MNRKERRAGKKQGNNAPQGAPSAVTALLSEAVKHHQSGHLAEAERLYHTVLQADARNADALHLLGVVSHQTGRHEIAAQTIAKAIAQNGHVAAFHWSLGNALTSLGKLNEAIASYGRALALKPNYAEAHRNLGAVFQTQGKLNEAEASFRQAIACNPALADARANLANVLQMQGKLDEAAAAYRDIVSLKPDLLEAHNNLGNILQMQGKLGEAIASYRQAMILKPEFAELHNNLGTALREQGKVDDAIVSYRQALAYKPDLAEAHSNLLMTLHYITGISAEALYRASLEFGKTFDKIDDTAVSRIDLSPERRLRIGYVSGDLCYHPVGYFLARVLTAHDKSRFEIFCYSNTAAADAMTDRLRGASDQWRNLVGLSDMDAHALINQDSIDILIDLSGHTARNRLTLFALRPAPLQVSWLGYFGTTGLAAMDYILMDAASVPPGEERWYSEAVIRLPHARFCYDAPETKEPADPPYSKNGCITFGSFNNIAKINADVVSLWADVLRAAPQSKLILKWKTLDDTACRQRLSDAFTDAGIAIGRLEFRGASPHEKMLAEYSDIDIALDPFPFCGGLTSCEALWMGVPVITLPGDTPASRQTLAFLQILRLDELVATSRADYVTKAVSLAADPRRLTALRHSLRPAMAASPLCDGAQFTFALETTFREMRRQHCAGEPQTSFDISHSDAEPVK